MTDSIIALVVTVLLALWRIPATRTTLLARVPRLPRLLQPIAPLALAAIGAALEGYASGLRGDALASHVAASAGEIGAIAIGLWHTAKRIWPAIRKAPPAAALLLLAPALVACGFQPTRSPSVPETAIAAVNVVDTALAKYIETAPENPPVDLALLTLAVERASTVAIRGGDPCLVVDDLTAVGSAIACTACVTVSRELARVADCGDK